MYVWLWEPVVASGSWQTRIPGCLNPGMYYTNPVAISCTWEHWQQLLQRQWQPWECQQQTWEHLELLWSSAGKSLFSWRTLLVNQGIIASSYRSTIFETLVFSMSYDLCMYISTHLHTVYLHWLRVVLESDLRCDRKWQFSELRDTVTGCDQANLEMHLDPAMQHIATDTWRPWVY